MTDPAQQLKAARHKLAGVLLPPNNPEHIRPIVQALDLIISACRELEKRTHRPATLPRISDDHALDRIQGMLDRSEWDSDLPSDIADIIRLTGRPIHDVDG